MSSNASTYLTTYPMFSPTSLSEPVGLRSNCHTPSKRSAHKAARTSRTSSTRAREALKLNLAKSTILDSQAEAKNGLENDTLDEPWAYTEEWVLKVGGGGQPRSEYNYEVSEGRHNIEIGEDGKVDTNTTDPGSDEDWTHWMSKEQIRTAYRDLYAVKNTSESSANLLQAESLSLTTQIFQANIELREKNLALTSQLLQASMELQKMKTFMAVAGEKLLKTGGRTNFGAEKLE